MDFTTKMGRLMLRRRHTIPSVVEKKWAGILPPSFKLRWATIWTSNRVKKESGLLWAMWHRAVAVNEWRGRINANLDQNCVVCNSNSKETILHRFWECPSARAVWAWCTKVIDALCPKQGNIGALPADPGIPGSPRAPGAPGGGNNQVSNSLSSESATQPLVTSRQTLLTWKQGLFAQRIPRRFKHCSRIWSLLRGLATWGLWKERNGVVF